MLFAVALILTACTDSNVTTEPPDSSVATTSVAPTTTTITTGPAATTTTTTTPPPVVEPPVSGTTPFTPLPLPDEELPHTLDAVTIGDAGLLYLGAISPTPRDHPNEGAFWHYDGDDWARTIVSEIASPDEFGSHPQTTNLVVWDGGYLGFIQPDWIDETTDSALPSLLTSADGRTWKVEPIFPRAAAGSGLGGTLPTPEAPPWPGAAGISSVTTTADEIVAVGWVVTSPGESTATVWRSRDGTSWTVSGLPNVQWPNEWAAEIAIGESGWLVSGAGPVYGATLLWYSSDGTKWTYISDAFQNDDGEIWWSFHQLASGANGLVINAGDLSAEYAEQIWRSDDGITWSIVGGRTNAPTTVASDGSTITRMRRGADSTIVDSSQDGETWDPVTSLDIKTDPERTWLHRLNLCLLGSTITITEVQNNEDYTETNAGIWIDAPEMDVVLVEHDDVLNVRDRAMGNIVDELDPAATDVQTTGRSDGAAGSLWLEILHDGRLGWVNSLYLTEPVEDFAAMDPLALVEEFAEDVFRSGRTIGPYVGPGGLRVGHYDIPKHWSRGQDPMSDPTIYIWGCPECSLDPGPTHHATFADWVGDGFLAG